ncbi:Toxin ParE1 [Devosia equisanguinis]|uniref:Toxin ParE1 n=2 Tax=Devosia equisanguinis TaxID=2490941 RepID=A0A3S4D6Z4_9HYPH|nr:Toxin ParE1 [Devosia equisanguinis]
MRFSLNYKAVMPMRAIDLKPLAREDWRGIWDHGIENWSATTAKSYYNRIANRLEDLAVGKLIGLPAYNYPGVLKSLIGSHAIYFRIEPKTLTVLRILHQGMDVGKNL